MSDDFNLRPSCDVLSDAGDWRESSDYSCCPECCAWSASDDVLSPDAWTCYGCSVLVTESDDECPVCTLSRETSDYMHENH